MRPRVAIIGGGITGLAAAQRLRELAPTLEVLLLEAGSRLGGVLHTTHQGGYLIESAADNFLTSPPAAVDLCCRLGLEHQLMGPNPSHRQALVVHRGQLQPIPAGFLVMAPSQFRPLLTSPILSWRGKLRAGVEYFLPRKKGDQDESLQSFVCRRFGVEVFDRLAQPLVGGIYTADPQRLSIEATMPRFRQMEREYGSLLRALRYQRRQQPDEQRGSGARYAQFATLRAGMSSLVDALASQLPEESVRFDSPVDGLFQAGRDRWLVSIGGSHPSLLPVDGVVVAVPAYHAARMLAGVDARVAHELRQIEYASCAVVSLGYRRDQIGHPLNGFGCVVPLVEKRLILSCSFSSVKYAGRAPEGAVLLRVFIGGACQADLLRLPRAHLVELAHREVANLLQIRGTPTLRHIVRQQHAMPQYYVGHGERVARIEARLAQFSSIALAGSALYGVGVPACIRSGEVAVERIVPHLQKIMLASPQSACT